MAFMGEGAPKMIHCKFVERTDYNPANGYTVASYRTEEELPQEVSRQNTDYPGRFTVYGIELREVVNPKRRGRTEIKNGKKLFRVGDIVMHTKNVDEVSSGDLGEVSGIYRKDSKMVMEVGFGDDRVVKFSEEDYWPLTHGYAMSVHKSQGNECPIVIIPLLGCFRRMLQRNILYTGITRATKQVILVGSKQAVAKAIRNNRMAKRNTNFAPRLRQVYKSMQEYYGKSA